MLTETCECGARFAVGLLQCPRCHAVAPRYASCVADGRPPQEEAPAAALDTAPFKDLRAMAKARGLSGAGTAAELAARIAEHDAAKAGTA